MKIYFENLTNNQNNQNVDNSNKISHRNSSGAGTQYNRMGFKIDISGTVMDNKAYEGHGKTAEDVMMEANGRNIALERNYMAVMSNSMSSADFARLQKEGFHIGQVDVETIVTVVDKIKAAMAASGQVVIGYTDDLSMEELKKITGNVSLAVSISKSFSGQNVPLTKDNVRSAVDAFTKAQQIPSLSDGALKYMITNKQAPTIDNVYLAGYSSTADSRVQAKGFFADDLAGYYGRKADGMSYDKLSAQMEKVISESGYQVDEKALSEAKWLVESGIPLTTESFTMLHELKDISFPMEPDKLFDAIARAVAEGKRPQDALLTKETDIYRQAKELLYTVNSATDEAVSRVVSQGQSFTIRSLRQAMQYIRTEQGDVGARNENKDLRFSREALQNTDPSLIRARRQLEEVRLQMTVEANVKLIKSGFSIDTAMMSEVIDKLKALEADKSQILFGTDNPEELTNRQETYQETLYKSSAIKGMPLDLIGKFAFLERKVTLDSVYEKGILLADEYQKAGRAYETMMTVPRADLGDSIKDAFRNIDFLLIDMEMEPSVQNNRAVRILAYNQMPINKESIAIVKNADETLRRVVEKLTPANTLYMVRDGVNPLEMDLNELYNYLEQIPQTKESDIEKFAKFIYKLDKKKEITPEEKEACIGIFRLMRQIEKGDYSSLGSVIDSNRSLTLMNLLSAVRTKNTGHINRNIDDNFGGVESLSVSGPLITEQINSYYSKKIDHIYESLEPEKLLQLDLDSDTTIEELETALDSMEKDEELENEYMRQQLEDVRQVSKVSDEAIEAVLEGKVTKNADYFLAADYLRNYRGETMRRLQRFAKQTDKFTNRITTGDKPLEEELKEAVDALYEGFNDKDAAYEGYTHFIETADEILTETSMLAGAQQIDMKSMVMYSKQMHFLSDMAREENYEIPITIDDEVTSINLKIIHNKQETRKVSISLQTLELSKVTAVFSVEADGIKGLIASNSKDGLEQLKLYGERITKEIGIRVDKNVDLQFVHSSKQDIKEEMREDTDEQVNTGDLYQIAKGFIFAIKKERN